jgi:hypothetical protein
MPRHAAVFGVEASARPLKSLQTAPVLYKRLAGDCRTDSATTNPTRKIRLRVTDRKWLRNLGGFGSSGRTVAGFDRPQTCLSGLHRVPPLPYCRTVVRWLTQTMSRLSAPMLTGKPVPFLKTGLFVSEDNHFLISAWPSANEKPQAPL